MKKVLALALTFCSLFATKAYADPTGGGGYTVDTVRPYMTDVYRVTYWGGEFGDLDILGNGYTDLDFYVYNEYGRLIACDDDFTDNCCLRFWVPHTQTLTIKIINRGGAYNRYVMHTY